CACHGLMDRTHHGVPMICESDVQERCNDGPLTSAEVAERAAAGPSGDGAAVSKLARTLQPRSHRQCSTGCAGGPYLSIVGGPAALALASELRSPARGDRGSRSKSLRRL